jgi:hypothetical protein
MEARRVVKTAKEARSNDMPAVNIEKKQRLSVAGRSVS